jgi:sugar phosphate permease
MRPSRIRFVVLFVVCLVYLITYLDRVNLSIAAPHIISEFGLSKLQWGLVLSVFSWTYTMGQIPIGMLADKYGSRIVLASIVIIWSVMDAVTGLVWGLGSLIAVRLAFGLCEAGAFPSATRALAPWIPKTERGFAQGLTHAFARFGGAITPVIAAIAIEYLGWRNMFFAFASLAASWGVFWYFWYRDSPRQFQSKWGKINQAEIDYIEEGRNKARKINLPFRVLLKSKNMWALALSYPCYCYVVWIYMTWLPQFLVEAHGLASVKMGIFASLPLLAGTVGDTLGGWLSDRIWRLTGRGKFSRRVVAMTGLLVAATFMIPGAMASTPGWAIFFLACALFGQEMAVGVYWAVCLDIGHEYSGTVSALMNSMGGVTSAMSPLVFAAILQFTGSWVYPFMVASAVLVIGALLWLRIDPEKSLVDELNLKALAVNASA